jgi:hypothetical protein
MSSTKRRVPVLQVNIPSPCQENWAEMAGDAQGRHCERCDHKVHDLSAMSPTAARLLVATARAGELCVRGYFTTDGQPVTHDEVAQRRALKRSTRGAMLAAAVLSLAGCDLEGSESLDREPLELAEPLRSAPDPGDAVHGDELPEGVVERTGEVAPSCPMPPVDTAKAPDHGDRPKVKMGKIKQEPKVDVSTPVRLLTGKPKQTPPVPAPSK